MIQNKKGKMILLAILLLASLLRFWKLGDYPALNADEAAIGYNAYSLIQTGRDEHGNPWPIHFQSFNDYKPGLYFYLVLPFVKLLGLNEWAVRIPGAALGVATIYAVYLLVGELFKKHNNRQLALLSALFIAISPWHIHFSRGGWEVNVSTFLIVLGLYFFLKAIRKPNILSSTLYVLPFTLSLYTYHAARVVVPLLILGLLVIYKNELKKNVKVLVASLTLGLLLLIPLVLDLTKGSVLSRAAGVGLLADPGPLARINEQRGEHVDFTGTVPVMMHNKLINYGLTYLENWSEHYHGEFLFSSGDIIQRNKVPETGQMYLADLLFVIVGLSAVTGLFIYSRNKDKGESKSKKGWFLVLWWLAIAPTAAALTFQSPHALRAQNMVIPLVIISAFGLDVILGWLKKQKRYLLVIGSLSIIILVFWLFARYQHMYWTHMAKEYPFSSQYGVKELVSYIGESKDEYEKIIVTDRYDQPYILFLFYLTYPPDRFQSEHELTARDKYGFSTVRNFDKYEFKSINWDIVQPNNPNSLIVGTDEEIPDEANVVKEIYGSNGYKYFEVVAN